MNKKTPRITIKPEDLFRLVFLQDAQLSPDRTTVVYTVSHTDIETDQELSTIWLRSLETGASRRLTNGLARDGSPRWSADGTQIAFLSNRDGKTQIYLMSVDTGQVRPLTALKQGVGGGPVWSPDGDTIAFTAGPPEIVIDTSKPYRVNRPMYRVDGGHCVENILQDIYLIPAKGGEPTQLTGDACQNIAPVWSPDGKEILFFTSLFPDSYRGFPALRVVDLEGRVRELVLDWGAAIAATWTPDGERVVFVGKPAQAKKGAPADLWVIDRQGGEPQCRTAGLSAHVGGALQPDMPLLWMYQPRILVTEDSGTVYVQVQDGGSVQVYRIGLEGPESWEPVITGERACFPMALADERLVFMVSTLHDPTNLFIAMVDGTHERQLTHLNADLLAEWDLPTVQRLSYPSTDGVSVEGWLLTPSVGQAPYPTVLYVHGGPHNAFGHIFFFDFLMLASAGYAVLFVNHRGSSGYGDIFGTQTIGDWGTLEYTDLMAGVDFVITTGLADPERMGCTGLSGGGHLTCWIVSQTGRFKAAVAENPVTNLVSMYGVSANGPRLCLEELGGHPHEIPEVYRRCSPITFAHRCTTPTLLIQGEADCNCPPEQSEQFYTVLKTNDCVVEMLRLPNSGHVGTLLGPLCARRTQNEALLDWMNRHVRGAA